MAKVVSYGGHPDQRYGHFVYSHCGEELVTLNLFELMEIKKPSYLDIGAHHPFRISNTALMYERGSRGVNIEANPNLIDDFKEYRPGDLIINVGVGPHRERLPLYMFDEWSGRNTFVKENAAPFFWDGKDFFAVEGPKIEIITLRDAVNRYCSGRFPDFLSIDIEGLDIDVMCSTDFREDGPKVALVEVHWLNPRVGQLKEHMTKNGYFCYCRMMPGLFFVQEKYRAKVY